MKHVTDPRLDAQLADEPARLRALNRTGLFDTPREPEFDAITELVREVFDVPICAITLIGRDRQFFKSACGLEISETPRSVAFCDHTIRAARVLVVEDAKLDPRFRFSPLVTSDPYYRSYAGAPLVTPDHYQIGALCVIDRRPRTFSDQSLALLQRFSALVVDAIELRTRAHEDYLTGARTRRAFTDELCIAVELQARGGQPAALVTLDIDHFKSINDEYGHAAGDEVLKAVARAVRSTLRADQPLGRLGGEEFGVLLPGASAGDALICAERMRSAIQHLALPRYRPVTASFGIAPLIPGQSIEQWTAASDCALYVAKRAGRNRCVLAPPDSDVAAA